MSIRLAKTEGERGLTRKHFIIMAAIGALGIVVASVPLVQRANEKQSTVDGRTVSADEAKLLAKGDEQRARAAAQAGKLRQQDMGQGFKWDGQGNLLGAPTEGGSDLPQNRPYDDGGGLRPVAGRLPLAARAAYPASIAISHGIEGESAAEGSPSGGGSANSGESEAEDRNDRQQTMLGYSTVAGASWAGRRPQEEKRPTPAGAGGAADEKPASGEAAVDRMVKLMEDSLRQGDTGARAESVGAMGGPVAAGGLWGGAASGAAAAGDALYPAGGRRPAEGAPQSMAPGAIGDMRIGGAVGADQVVRQGKFLDCAVVNEIRADLVESPVIAMVARDFVSLDGKYVLVPAGSKLLGEAGRVQNLQQERVYIKFDRVLFPDQRSAYFPVRKVPAVDGMGAVGVSGDVDRHFFLQFGSAVMLGVLDGIGAAVQSPGSGGNPTLRDLMMARTSANFSTVLGGVLQRYANVVPTVTVAAGSKLKVFFSEDVRMSPYMRSSELSWVGGAP